MLVRFEHQRMRSAIGPCPPLQPQRWPRRLLKHVMLPLDRSRTRVLSGHNQRRADAIIMICHQAVSIWVIRRRGGLAPSFF